MGIHRFFFWSFALLLSSHSLFAKQIDTFYGSMEVTEPVVLELIESRPMQRLKKVHQYGVSYYTSHKEEYTRYDHCLGVFAILRMNGLPLKEQVAGLIHDISHTVFSHVGDYVFKYDGRQDSYQDRIHEWFLEKYGIGKILKKHGYSVAEMNPDTGEFHALEQDLPNLCADRIDYNIQGAYHRGFLTKSEAISLIHDLQFTGGKWVSTKPDLLRKVVRFSLFMTEDCWGSADNYLKSSWLAEVIVHALKTKEISWDDIYFGTDDWMWDKLTGIQKPYIQERFQKILRVNDFFRYVASDKRDQHIVRKFRGIDPLIQRGKQLKRLTEIDPKIAKEFRTVKERMERGWSIKNVEPALTVQ